MDDLDQPLGKLEYDRRTFIRRIAIGAAFATPVVTSFSMSGLTMNSAAAQVSNESIFCAQNPEDPFCLPSA